MPTLLSRATLGSVDSLRVSGIPDSSITAPQGSIAYDLKTGKRYTNSSGGGWSEIISPAIPSPSNVPLHSVKHIRGGVDEIDGDRLDIDFVPTSYVSTTSGTGISSVTSTQHLAAHLKGIDNALSASGSGGSSEISSFTFTPEEYGALGDGTTDDTAAIQAAYDAAHAVGGVLQFGAKTYKITTAIQTRKGYTTIRGVAGSRGTQAKFNFPGLANELSSGPYRMLFGTIIRVFGSSAFVRDDITISHGCMTIENICFLGNGSGSRTPIDFGFQMTNASCYNRFINIAVFNFEVGFDISQQYGSSWESCRANACNIGFQNGYDAPYEEAGANRARITNVDVSACNICFYTTHGNGIEISNVLAQGDCGQLLYLKPRGQGDPGQISISHVHYETNNANRALCVFDGEYSFVSPSHPSPPHIPRSVAEITLSHIFANVPWVDGSSTEQVRLRQALQLVNWNGVTAIYRMNWVQIKAVPLELTLHPQILGTVVQSCRFRNIDVTNPSSIQVSMSQSGSREVFNLIKENGTILLGSP